jgi:hypothetical protein
MPAAVAATQALAKVFVTCDPALAASDASTIGPASICLIRLAVI